MPGQWTYWEFALSAPLPEPVPQVLARLLNLAPAQIRPQDDFIASLSADSPLMLEYKLVSVPQNLRFGWYLDVTATHEFMGPDTLRLAVELAHLTRGDVATGDFTGQGEFVIIKPGGWVYHTTGGEYDGVLELEESGEPTHFTAFVLD
jgi:hypothetical protein